MTEEISTLAHQIDWSAWVTTVATVALMVLTAVYVRLTKKLLSSQSDPCVILSLVHDLNQPTILQLVVKNIGTGLAHDVSFSLNRSIPQRAMGIDEQSAEITEDMFSGPLISGIPALGPGETRVIDWGQYGGLKKALGNDKIIVSCIFYKNKKKLTPMICPVDIHSYSHTVANPTPISKIADSLDELSKDLKHMTTGFKKLQIEVKSMPPKEIEEEKNNKK